MRLGLQVGPLAEVDMCYGHEAVRDGAAVAGLLGKRERLLYALHRRRSVAAHEPEPDVELAKRLS